MQWERVSRRCGVMAVAWAMCLVMGCASGFIEDDNFYEQDSEFQIDQEARIRDTLEHRQALDVLAKYRQALVRKDFGTLDRLIAEDYYDNSSTTNTTKDDYGRTQLADMFEMLANHAESIRYKIVVKDITLARGVAAIDYEFRYAYQYKVGDTSSWDAGVEVNRVEVKRQQDDVWKIVSGL